MSDARSKAASFLARRKATPHPQRDDSEATRYSDEQVVFHHEFTLGTSEDVYPPGRYIVETGEDSYAASGHSAHLRKSTLLIVPTESGTRAMPINVRELEAALKEDAERDHLNTKGESPGTSSGDSRPTESIQSQLERYGIERVPADVFLWGGYRYTNAGDAVAAARRVEKR